jgi:hypothetical protein
MVSIGHARNRNYLILTRRILVRFFSIKKPWYTVLTYSLCEEITMEIFEQQLLVFESKLQAMTDHELVGQVSSLFAREKRIGDAILLGLKEIKVRRIYVDLGYPSLFEMLVKHFRLSESSTYTRLQALKLIEAVPEVQGDLFTGALSLTNAALAQSFIQQSEKDTNTPLSIEERKEVIDAVKGKSQKEARATLAEKNPKSGLPPNREKPITLKHTQLQITVDAETMAALTEVKELLSHCIPDGDIKEVLKYMIQLTGTTLKKRKGQSAPTSRSTSLSDAPDAPVAPSVLECSTVAEESCVRSRNIPIETKRIVFGRAGGCCEFVNQEGVRCQSKHQLEVDHKIPWSQGGTHKFENLQVMCRSHNLFRTKETHGFWYQARRV